MQSKFHRAIKFSRLASYVRIKFSLGPSWLIRFKSLRRTYATGKELRYGVDARQLMLEGVQSTARAVGVTLGPKVKLSHKI